MPQNTEIESRIIWRVYRETASPEELCLFDNWLKANSNNERYFKNFCEKIEAERYQLSETEFEKSWKQVYYSIALKKKIYTTLKYAAAIAIPLILSVSIFYLSDIKQPYFAKSDEILPGVSRATLFLSDGSTVELEDDNSDVVLEDGGQVIGKDSSNVITYDNVDINRPIYNTVKIPYGGEYQLVLSDGTKVWLNSGSSLQFPVSFGGDNREVTLTGEAYFQVKHDKNMPFIVNVNKAEVKVLGTSFNIKAYNDEDRVETTLVTGKVLIANLVKNVEKLMEPGYQVQIQKEKGDMNYQKVNAGIYTAWKDGRFEFVDEPIESILKTLSRWYCVNVELNNEQEKDIRLTMRINRYGQIQDILNLIEEVSDVKYEIKSNKVIVRAF